MTIILREEGRERKIDLLKQQVEPKGFVKGSRRRDFMQNFDASKDYYEVLGISSDATAETIEKAYRNAARSRHPDSGGSEEDMKALNEARDLLSNRETREAYDEARKPVGIAYGSSYAFDADGAAKAAAFETPVDDEGFNGAVMSAAICLGLGMPFLILVESQWMFFLWPLRIMAFCLICLGIWMGHSALAARHRMQKKINSAYPRSRIVFSELLFWGFAAVGAAMFVVAFYWH
jgi:curved DNA-binding protein CbpA